MKRIALSGIILPWLILFSYIGSNSYSQTQLANRSTVTIKSISDGVDFLMELYSLRRAYIDLNSNYSIYRWKAEITLKAAVETVISNQQKEVDHWKLAWEDENKWYKKFWFGATVATIVMVAIAMLVK